MLDSILHNLAESSIIKKYAACVYFVRLVKMKDDSVCGTFLFGSGDHDHFHADLIQILSARRMHERKDV